MIRKILRNLRHAIASDTPWYVYWKLVCTMIRQPGLREKHRAQVDRFRDLIGQKSFRFNWSGPYVHNWFELFTRYGMYDRQIRALEIGSWEGMSSVFVLSHLPRCHLQCVDTWSGAQEHQGMRELKTVEEKFDENVSEFGTRLSKFKGTSHEFLSGQTPPQRFDLIFVDGSHRSGDVIVDAFKSFELLEVGGVMVFDDYFWKYYREPKDNPAAAINAFLRLKRGSYELVAVYWQLVIRKTKDDDYQAA